jgi:methylphosphotriester-DNA--protein-cysteine methyltransferase
MAVCNLRVFGRPFSRHFHAETGLTFERWRTAANHQKAIELMSNGESVTSVALTLGYESVPEIVSAIRANAFFRKSEIRFLNFPKLKSF